MRYARLVYKTEPHRRIIWPLGSLMPIFRNFHLNQKKNGIWECRKRGSKWKSKRLVLSDSPAQD